jgi:hypothetical protein
VEDATATQLGDNKMQKLIDKLRNLSLPSTMDIYARLLMIMTHIFVIVCTAVIVTQLIK